MLKVWKKRNKGASQIRVEMEMQLNSCEEAQTAEVYESKMVI